MIWANCGSQSCTDKAMVGIIHDSRALQALLQKYRDLPSRLSANTKQKTHQFVKVGIFQKHLRWSLYKSKSKQKSWFRRNVHRGDWRYLATHFWGAECIEKCYDKHAVLGTWSPFRRRFVIAKSLIKLDPVGSTVRYEMMKLCTGSV